MNKNVIIATLVALLIGIGIGFSMNQVARSGAESNSEAPAASIVETSTSSLAEQGSGTTTQNGSSATPAEEIGSQSSSSGIISANSDDAAQETQNSASNTISPSASVNVVESGTYTSKDEVAAYIHEFGHLPSNYISKSKAKKAGWVAKEGNLDEVLPGMSIGGSEFYNDEGQLPDAPGRTWTECDINYEGGYRGAERIVFSSDGLIFYTADHYETFEQLY